MLMLLLAMAGSSSGHTAAKAIECAGTTEFTTASHYSPDPMTNSVPRHAVFILNDAARRILSIDDKTGEAGPVCDTGCKITYNHDHIVWDQGDYTGAIDRVAGTWKEVNKSADSTSMSSTNATCHTIQMPSVKKAAPVKRQF